MKDLSQQEWATAIQTDTNAVILDVRTDEEFSEGYIKNAKQIDIYQAQQFMEEVNALDKSKTYYIYCRSGGRSAQACMLLEQMGFNEAFNLQGGFSEWQGEIEK
ncbi:rhodanese-related sulfurtransferase [Mesonia hippocampi]|uniref:Rhodanese-related sulfurtransferase n=1 Tax=Mesonia hippocampi TaxID=1628250 RepID=A0A840EPF7_9FLAO|nr:rhodanese-like domain-containing protein [Mesonia hippocampi]MBB4118975.1 rhodanese-related sulfurtransferase [Mesonia hippocampi]